MMADYYKLPVPESPPNEGDFLIVGFNIDWLPIILEALQPLRSPTAWDNPPDDITGQVDELIYLIGLNLDP